MHCTEIVRNTWSHCNFFDKMWNQDYVNILVKICVCDVNSTLKLKSKIVVSNNDLSIAEILETTKLETSRKRQYISNLKYQKSTNTKIEIPVLRKRKCYGSKRRLSSYRLTFLVFLFCLREPYRFLQILL